MDLALVIAALSLMISLGACCVLAFWLFQSRSDPDVDELASQVLALRKAHRAEQMRRVRETPPKVGEVPADDSPPGFVAGRDPMATMSKDELRKIAFGIDPMRKH